MAELRQGSTDPFSVAGPVELAGESTRLLDTEALPDQSTLLFDEEAPRLLVEMGSDQGKQFALAPGETSVGRGIDNTIVLTDISVSRNHMSVVRDAHGVTLLDRGSGNGTRVNGQKVARVLLQPGHRIHIGETVLRLHVPAGPGVAGHAVPFAAPLPPAGQAVAAAPAQQANPFPGAPGQARGAMAATDVLAGGRPSEAGSKLPFANLPRPARVALLIAGAVTVVLIGAALTTTLLRSGNGDTPVDSPSPDQAYFRTGVNEYMAKRYAAAEAAFKQALAADPTSLEAQRYLELTQQAMGPRERPRTSEAGARRR